MNDFTKEQYLLIDYLNVLFKSGRLLDPSEGLDILKAMTRDLAAVIASIKH